MIAIDTNVLVAAHRRESAHHRAAGALVRALAEGADPWGIPWTCVAEFHAVVTHPRLWGGRESTTLQAWAQLDAWRASPTLRLLGETEASFAVLRELASRPKVRGSAVHDARVAAQCLVHGVRELLSCDRDFGAFPELRTRNPFRPA